MASGNTDVKAPRAIVLPSIPVADQATAGQTGSIGVSGATLVFYNGSAWKSATTN